MREKMIAFCINALLIAYGALVATFLATAPMGGPATLAGLALSFGAMAWAYGREYF